jgi:hypothetical protein
MKLKVNLTVREQDLTAHVDVAIGGQRRCAQGRCRIAGIQYTFAIEDVLARGGQEPPPLVAQEAKRILRRELKPARALCTRHFGMYVARIGELDGIEVEIIEL